MKISFTKIIGAYFLFLIIQPCSDMTVFCNDGSSGTTVSVYESGDHDHHDSCTPLCYCLCCNAPVIIGPGPVVSFALSNSKFNFSKVFSLTKNLCAPPWQPPETA